MPGLRETKKAATSAALQKHALRLIAERGWAATTVDDIAEAAQVSRSTFFRYFPTKVDAVLYDDVDDRIADALRRQAPGTPLLTAIRSALRTAFGDLAPDKRAHEELRMRLARSVPEIAAAARERNAYGVAAMAEGLARALGLDPGDPDAAVFAGAVVGSRLAAQYLADRTDDVDYIDAMDTALARLEDGVPLADRPLPPDWGERSADAGTGSSHRTTA